MTNRSIDPFAILDAQHDPIADFLRVDDEALNEEYVRLPAELAVCGVRYADAQRSHAFAEVARKRTEARLRLQIVAEATGADGKCKKTVGTIDAEVLMDPGYEEAMCLEIESEATKDRARAYRDGVAAKRDMLVTLGAHARQERGAS